MPPRANNILPYAPPPGSHAVLRALARRLLIAVVIVAILLFIGYYALIHGPTSAQVRLDSGDVRYCWFGIPLSYTPTPEPFRSKILSLKSPAVPAKWVTFQDNPWQCESEPPGIYEYRYVGIWADEDPAIARWALEDVADFIEHAKWGLPKSYTVLSPFVIDNMTDKLPSNWRDNDDVKNYCATHAYTPRPALEP